CRVVEVDAGTVRGRRGSAHAAVLDASQESDAPLIADPPVVTDAEHEAEADGRVRLRLWSCDFWFACSGNVSGHTWGCLRMKAAFLVEVPIDERTEERELGQPEMVRAGFALNVLGRERR